MYIPPNCTTLDKMSEAQIRLGIQGFPGSGKTYGALTFPNPVIANLDRGLGAHRHRTDAVEVPLWSESYCKSFMKFYENREDMKDLILKWINEEAIKLTPEQTLIWDGGTATQNAFTYWFNQNKGNFTTKNGEIDGFAEYKEKIKFYTEFFETLKVLPCHVIYISHEIEKADKDGSYRGKIRPLLTGQVGAEVVSHFSDWVRQLAMDKTDPKPEDAAKIKDVWNLSIPEYKSMQDSFPRKTIYSWQLESDDTFDGKCSSLINFPRFIPANYESFFKYRK